MKELINKPLHDDCFNIFPKIPNKAIDLLLTDIPYGEVNMESNGLRDLNRGFADVVEFNLNDFLTQCERVCKGSVYIFCGIEQISEIRKFFREKSGQRD